jgi:hypothetical protein
MEGSVKNAIRGSASQSNSIILAFFGDYYGQMDFSDFEVREATLRPSIHMHQMHFKLSLPLLIFVT